MKFSTESKVLVQGLTHAVGLVHTQRMLAYGTPIVAGVTPGYGGSTLATLPMFDLVDQAVTAVGSIETSLLFVPPFEMLDNALEAIDAGIRQLVLITEGVPPLDMIRLIQRAEQTETLLVGSNSTGVIVPGQVLLGTHPPQMYTPGQVGIISRSGTLTFEVALALTQAGIGQSFCVGIGSDPIMGSTFAQWLQFLDEHDSTEAIVLVGEIGGSAEEEAAQYVSEMIDKPVVAYIAGVSAPEGKRMGHAGAVINPVASDRLSDDAPRFWDGNQTRGTAQHKIKTLISAGIPVAERPSQIPQLLSSLFGQDLEAEGKGSEVEGEG